MRLDCGIMSNYEAPLPCHVLEELAFIDQSPKISSAKESDEGPLVSERAASQSIPDTLKSRKHASQPRSECADRTPLGLPVPPNASSVASNTKGLLEDVAKGRRARTCL